MEQTEHADIDGLWIRFKNKIVLGMEKFYPSKLMKGNTFRKPWVTKRVKALQNRQKKLFVKMKKARKSKTERAYKAVKAAVQWEERKAYYNYVDNLIGLGDAVGDTPKQKRFWSFIKNTRKDNTGISPLKENIFFFSPELRIKQTLRICIYP